VVVHTASGTVAGDMHTAIDTAVGDMRTAFGTAAGDIRTVIDSATAGAPQTAAVLYARLADAEAHRSFCRNYHLCL